MRVFFTLIVALVSLLHALPVHAQEGPVWSPGVLDLTSVDIPHMSNLPLEGEWELYWQQLLDPMGIQEGMATKPAYVKVPSKWGSYTLEGKPLSNQGYATYRLVIKMPHTAYPPSMALYMRGTATSFRLWMNGHEIAGNGVVGTSRATMVAMNYPKIVHFQPQEGDNELVIQVSNFVQRKGGIWEAPRLGNAEAISHERTTRFSSELFIVGGLLVMGIYHVSLFLFRKKDPAPLYFGLLCLSVSARIVVVGEATAIYLFPGLSWEAAVKIEYISVFLAMLMLVLFVQGEYSKSKGSFVKKTSYLVQGLFTLFVLLTPARVYTLTMLPYQLLVIVPVLIYILFMYIRAFMRNQEGSLYNLFGFIAFGASAALEILLNNQVVAIGSFVPYGILFFLLTQSLNISSKFSRTYRHAEALSAQLQIINESLERTVEARTLDLQQTNRHLEAANAELSRMAQFRRQLLSDVSHELGTPLTTIRGYASAMIDGFTEDHIKYAQRIYERTYLMERLIHDIMELMKLETRQIRFDFQRIKAIPFFQKIYHLYEAEAQEHTMSLQVEESAQAAEHGLVAFMNADPLRLEQVISNLLSNARKYTPAGGQITLEVVTRYTGERQGEATFRVKDTGRGIPEGERERVFERFYRASERERTGLRGSGLGLSISKEIIMYHHGQIGLEHTSDTGSIFYFKLPMEWVRIADKER
ncbi:ATP-binding protein [Paenibacillus sp. GCM10027628]|uniref:sensor histidine kinase n=1 Tax=Paenibacillus sp. GCM10027628 TaxID=3273413 RepID=UPI003644BA2D